MMSLVQAQRDHNAQDCRFLNFRKGDIITVYYKLSGKRNDLWGGSVSKLFYLWINFKWMYLYMFICKYDYKVIGFSLLINVHLWSILFFICFDKYLFSYFLDWQTVWFVPQRCRQSWSAVCWWEKGSPGTHPGNVTFTK